MKFDTLGADESRGAQFSQSNSRNKKKQKHDPAMLLKPYTSYC